MRYIYFCLVIVFICIIGCKSNREAKEIKQMYGQEIRFDIPLEIVDKDTIQNIKTLIDNDNDKLLFWMGDITCRQCVFNLMYNWNKVIDSLDISIELIVILNDNAISLYDIKNDLNNYNMSVRIIQDKDSCFFLQNNFNELLVKNRNFLLDKNNRVVLTGDPLNNRSMFKLYINTIMEMEERN